MGEGLEASIPSPGRPPPSTPRSLEALQTPLFRIFMEAWLIKLLALGDWLNLQSLLSSQLGVRGC